MSEQVKANVIDEKLYALNLFVLAVYLLMISNGGNYILDIFIGILIHFTESRGYKKFITQLIKCFIVQILSLLPVRLEGWVGGVWESLPCKDCENYMNYWTIPYTHLFQLYFLCSTDGLYGLNTKWYG